VTTLAGRYELGDTIGVGGSSWVLRAHDHVLRRDVAIKLLAPGAGDELRERFLQEARAAASIAHPNVVVVYDVGEDQGRPYMVMELVDGHDMAQRLAVGGALPVYEAVAVLAAVLDALGALHAVGIVHRDVKPGNILQSRDGRVCLTDFGIARAPDLTAMTAHGSVLGTPPYLPPEQALGREATAAGDLYSAGAVGFELLTGEPPFGRGATAATALAHLREAVPSVASRREGVPAAVDAVVVRALAKDPEARWPSAQAMRAALLEAVGAAAEGATLVAPRSTVPTTAMIAIDAATSTMAAPVGTVGGALAATSLGAPTRHSGPRPGGDADAPASLPTRRFEPVAMGPALSRRTGRRRASAAVLLLLVVLGLFVVLAARRGSDPPASSSPAGTPSTTVTAPTVWVPRTLPELIAGLQVTGAESGSRADDLLARLRGVQAAHGKHQRELAASALDSAEGWARRHELDQTIADLTARILAPLTKQGGGEGND